MPNQNKKINKRNSIGTENNEHLYRLAQLRMDDFHVSAENLAKKAEQLKYRANIFRIIIIVLGVIVAIKGVADQLMLTYQANNTVKLIADVTFSVIGLLISTIAWSQDAFNPAEKAAGIMELANRAEACAREYMHKIGTSSSQDLNQIIAEQNSTLEKLYSDATRYNVNLTFESKVDFSKIIKPNSKV